VRAPLSFAYGNLLFGASLQDAWALFVCPAHAYAGLSAQGKHEQLGQMASALAAVGADVQLIRVGRAWARERYVHQQHAIDTPHPQALAAYLDDQSEVIAQVGSARPWCAIAVRLAEPQRDLTTTVERISERPARQWWRAAREAIAWHDRRLLRASELERLRLAADRAHALLADQLDVRPARSAEVQWLVRRAFCRGLGDPVVDELHEPQALVFEANGEALLEPLEADVPRWCDGLVEHRGRALRIDSELGCSWQAQVVLGALPERAVFPGARAEALFVPVEALPFPVDVCLAGRFVPNELALRLVQRRIRTQTRSPGRRRTATRGSPTRASSAPLLGATAVFGVRSEQEAGRVLALLGLDPDDERLRRQLLEFSAGRCLLRDHQGRIEAVQVDLASRRLLAGLSTTPAAG
jgi:AAA-like domain